MNQEELASCADEMYAIKQERSSIKKSFEKSDNRLKTRLSELEESLIEALGKPKGMRSLKTDNVTATFKVKKVFNAKNWEQIYAYIKKHDAWDLLSKKLSNKAVTDRLNDGDHKDLRKAVEPFQKKSISLTVVKN